MRIANRTPSIVPSGDDQTVYLVADDFGKPGRAWVETDIETADLETVVQDLLTGQYNNPIRVIPSTLPSNGLKTFPKTSRTSSGSAVISKMRDVPFYLHDFTDRHEGRYRDVQLPLPMRLA